MKYLDHIGFTHPTVAPHLGHGDLYVGVQVNGSCADHSFWSNIDDGRQYTLIIPEAVRVHKIRASQRTIRLAGVAGNCEIMGTNPQRFYLMADETTLITFEVRYSDAVTAFSLGG